MNPSKERSGSRPNTSFDYSSDFYQSQQQPQRPPQQLGFFASLTQSIFGGGSKQNQNNLNRSQQMEQGYYHHNTTSSSNSRMNNSGHAHRSTVQNDTGRQMIPIFLDLGFKNSTIQRVTDETTASEVIKNLKQKYLGGVTIPNSSHKSSNFNQLSYSSSSERNQPDFRKNTSLGQSSSATSQPSNGQGLNTSVHSQASSSGGFSKSNFLGAGSAHHTHYSNQRQDNFKDEYGLFMINTRAQDPMLFVRRLLPHDQIQRIYLKALEMFNKDGPERFKIVFQRNGDIDQFIRSKGGSAFGSHFDEENHVVTQLGKSIINNKTYERKGKLYKKSQNSDKFKERQFVLDKDQLFYYKNEKQKEKNFNLIMLSNAQLSNVQPPAGSKHKHCFEIATENRKYILATKSEYDLTQWIYAIQGQIRLSRDNKNIAEVNMAIKAKEKEIVSQDMGVIQRIFKPKNVIFNPTQPILLDFINDPFINELLPNLTKYVSLSSNTNYQRHALDKAKDIMQQLNLLLKKLEKSFEPEKVTPQEEEYASSRKILSTSGKSVSATDFLEEEEKVQLSTSANEQLVPHARASSKHEMLAAQSMQLIKQSSQMHNEDFKRYKELRPAQKIQQIFSQEDYDIIKQEYERTISDSLDGTKQLVMNQKMFNSIIIKINRIIKYNYIEDFFKVKKVELLSIPTLNFKQSMPKMEFNSIGPNINSQALRNLLSHGDRPSNSAKNVNIFEHILVKKAYSLQQQSRQPQNQLDSTFQSQLRAFINNISQEQRMNQSNLSSDDRASNSTNISGISKVTASGYR